MSSAAFKLLFALLLVGAIAACARTAPIYNVSQMPVTANKPNVSADEVGKAIIRAGAGLGWQMKQVKPGQILGTLTAREHQAVVDVTYNAQSYSINYKDSANLKYDGQMIHQNYNGWIQRLDNAIRATLSTL
jgi:hypothetical protein